VAPPTIGAKHQIYHCNGTDAQQRITTDEGTNIKPKPTNAWTFPQAEPPTTTN
jgi:hypothetical protein